MRVYGALMWSLGKVINTPEVVRVYLGSFWAKPLQNTENRWDTLLCLFVRREWCFFNEVRHENLLSMIHNSKPTHQFHPLTEAICFSSHPPICLKTNFGWNWKTKLGATQHVHSSCVYTLKHVEQVLQLKLIIAFSKELIAQVELNEKINIL